MIFPKVTETVSGEKAGVICPKLRLGPETPSHEAGEAAGERDMSSKYKNAGPAVAQQAPRCQAALADMGLSTNLSPH